MISRTFQLSPLFVGLLTVWKPAQAEEFRHTCMTPTLCDYSILHSTLQKESNAPITTYHWIFSDKEREIGDSSYQKLGQAIPENRLVATLKPQHYQNVPAIETGNGSDNRFELIRLSNLNIVDENGITKFKPLGNATLIIPTGTTATLDKAKLNSELISISAANAIIEKGVTLTVNPSYAEANSIETPDNYNSETGRAIDVSGEANVTTSADIILNGKEAFRYLG